MLYVAIAAVVLVVIGFMVLASRSMSSTWDPKVQSDEKDQVKNAGSKLGFVSSIFNWSGRR